MYQFGFKPGPFAEHFMLVFRQFLNDEIDRDETPASILLNVKKSIWHDSAFDSSVPVSQVWNNRQCSLAVGWMGVEQGW